MNNCKLRATSKGHWGPTVVKDKLMMNIMLHLVLRWKWAANDWWNHSRIPNCQGTGFQSLFNSLSLTVIAQNIQNMHTWATCWAYWGGPYLFHKSYWKLYYCYACLEYPHCGIFKQSCSFFNYEKCRMLILGDIIDFPEMGVVSVMNFFFFCPFKSTTIQPVLHQNDYGQEILTLPKGFNSAKADTTWVSKRYHLE